MKSTMVLTPLVVAVSLLTVPVAAKAGLIVEISDGSSVISVTDNGANDGFGLSPSLGFGSTLGLVGYAGNIGSWDMSVAIASGTSDPFSMHLSSIVMGTPGDTALTIKLTYTDLVAGQLPLAYSAFGGGAGALGAGGTWTAYVDDSNTAFGTGTQIASSSGFATAQGYEYAGLSGLYSATIVTTFDYSKASGYYLPYVGYLPTQSSMDVNMNVPEPTSLALVGLALLGLGAARRRKG